MDSLQHEIENALLSLGEESLQVAGKEALCRAIEQQYVAGQPAKWWLSLKHIERRIPCDDNTGYLYIHEAINGGDATLQADTPYVYCIVQEDQELVYRLHRHNLAPFVAACRFFEWYVVPPDYSWLLCETEHSEVIWCRAGACSTPHQIFE